VLTSRTPRRKAANGRQGEHKPLSRILRPKDLCALLGVTRQALWLMRRSGEFPRGLKLTKGGAIGWREDVVREWLDSRPAA